MFLKYVRSTEERRQEFWGLVNEFCNQIEKIDHVLVEAFQNDLKNKRMLLAEQRYQEFLNYDEIEKYMDFGGIRMERDILIQEDVQVEF